MRVTNPHRWLRTRAIAAAVLMTVLLGYALAHQTVAPNPIIVTALALPLIAISISITK